MFSRLQYCVLGLALLAGAGCGKDENNGGAANSGTFDKSSLGQPGAGKGIPNTQNPGEKRGPMLQPLDPSAGKPK
jgi:hypothetical protein